MGIHYSLRFRSQTGLFGQWATSFGIDLDGLKDRLALIDLSPPPPSLKHF